MHLTRPCVAAGAAWGAIAGALSYPLQRLAAAAVGEVPYSAIVAQEHIPYYWRVVLALFQAVLVGLIVAFATDEEQATRSLGWVPAGVGLVGVLAVAMGVVP